MPVYRIDHISAPLLPAETTLGFMLKLGRFRNCRLISKRTIYGLLLGSINRNDVGSPTRFSVLAWRYALVPTERQANSIHIENAGAKPLTSHAPASPLSINENPTYSAPVRRSTSSAIIYSSSVGITATVTAEPAALITCAPLPTAALFFSRSTRTPSHSRHSQNA